VLVRLKWYEASGPASNPSPLEGWFGAHRWYDVSFTGRENSLANAPINRVQYEGFPDRYPKEIQALLTPITWDGSPVRSTKESQTPVTSLPADHPHQDEKKNDTGPLLIAYGDSNAQHLIFGLNLLQNERPFRVKLINWHDCPPVGDIKSTEIEICRRQEIATEEEITRLKPDIVVIGAFWFKYKHIEPLSKTLKFFQRIAI
jgi:hypothetical protein